MRPSHTGQYWASGWRLRRPPARARLVSRAIAHSSLTARGSDESLKQGIMPRLTRRWLQKPKLSGEVK
jgi:hypothetical protein